MADGTAIEWTDATVNAVNGCTVHSPGCTNCYAMRLAGSRLKHHPSRAGLTRDTKAGPVWTGEVRLHEPALLQPLRWARPRRIFWNAHGDLFHEAVPDEWIDRVLAVCALTPQHTHQILTKRSARMRDYMGALSGDWHDRLAEANPPGSMRISKADARRRLGTAAKFSGDPQTPSWPLPNVWLGVSVENQKRADERIPDLLATPAAVRWISAEPLLGPVDLTRVFLGEGGLDCVANAPPEWKAIRTVRFNVNALEGAPSIGWGRLDWVVVGGESGPGARPMHPDWARSLRDQCAAAGVPFLFKQWGEYLGGQWSGDGETVYFSSVDLSDDTRAFIGQISDRDSERGDDSWWSRLHTWDDDDMPDGQGPAAFRVGKGKAGRHLDGVLHDGFPAAQPDMVAF